MTIDTSVPRLIHNAENIILVFLLPSPLQIFIISVDRLHRDFLTRWCPSNLNWIFLVILVGVLRRGRILSVVEVDLRGGVVDRPENIVDLRLAEMLKPPRNALIGLY